MPLRIMIIEDEEIIALDLQDMLERGGHTMVGHATNYAAAMKLGRKTRPQVALCDMDLKGEKNGLDAAAALGEAYGIVSLFITARSDFLVRTMALPLEPLGYLAKPFQQAEVLAALAAYRAS